MSAGFLPAVLKYHLNIKAILQNMQTNSWEKYNRFWTLSNETYLKYKQILDEERCMAFEKLCSAQWSFDSICVIPSKTARLELKWIILFKSNLPKHKFSFGNNTEAQNFCCMVLWESFCVQRSSSACTEKCYEVACISAQFELTYPQSVVRYVRGRGLRKWCLIWLTAVRKVYEFKRNR